MKRSPRVLALSGSARASGSTERVIEVVRSLVTDRGATFECAKLREFNINNCGACGNCNRLPHKCTVEDDVPLIIDKMLASDIIFYATPVHAFDMATTMQTFLERAGVGYLRFSRPLANKVGGVIVTGRRYNHTQVYNQLLLNMLLNRMIVVGSGFPAVVHSGDPKDVSADQEGLDSVQRMVERAVDLSVLLESAKEARPELLPEDPHNERLFRLPLHPDAHGIAIESSIQG